MLAYAPHLYVIRLISEQTSRFLGIGRLFGIAFFLYFERRFYLLDRFGLVRYPVVSVRTASCLIDYLNSFRDLCVVVVFDIFRGFLFLTCIRH